MIDILLKQTCFILIEISMQLHPKYPLGNESSLAQIVDKLLSEPLQSS